MGGTRRIVSKSKSRKETTAARRTTRSQRGDRSKRLLDLVMLLLGARSPVTFREIRAQFDSYQTHNVEAGLRAFERDKADLLELGVPIRYVTPEEDDALEEGGYVIDMKRYRLPEVRLTADEVSALVLAASVARAVPGGSTPKIVDLTLKKLAFDMPEPPDTPTEWPPPASAVTQREPLLVHFPSETGARARELSDKFAQLEAATRNRKRITVRYQNASTGLVNNREIDPCALVYHQGSWVLVGYCHLRKDVRSFRVDRIGNLKIAPKPKSPDFERPEGFDARSYVARSPWTFESAPPEKVVLEMQPESADVAHEDFGPDAAKQELDGGAMRVTFTLTNPDFAVSKILAAKGGIRVLEGRRLHERVADELAAIRRRYR